MASKSICITGHRFWKNPKEEKRKLFSSLDILMSRLNKKATFLSGCAYGVDTWFGEYARINGIDLHLYFPFTRIIQIVKSKHDTQFYKELNKQFKVAKKVVYVSLTFYNYGYQKRNIALVDNSDLLLTYYTRQRSGSGNCYKYALLEGLFVIDVRVDRGSLNEAIIFCYGKYPRK